MGYVGTCGGCQTASSGVYAPGEHDLFMEWGLWPGKFVNRGPRARQPFPNVVFDGSLRDHPLYKYMDKGVLRNVFFNGGPLDLEAGVPDTQYLGKYEGGVLTELSGRWFMIDYKPKGDGLCGRCVITSGHPEANNQQFFKAMVTYALDRDYEVPR
ncbi:MAG: hypothetical protein NTV49_02920, partial [Kiritimatiellaeota bacterium]|nr:hypothetical protein [Kiritimatiellota bacterium]